MEINEKLKELRDLKGLKQIDIANHLGLTRSAYANYEQGRRELSPQMIKKLAIFFDVTTDYLLGLEDEGGIKIYKKKALDNKSYEFTFRDNENTFLHVKKKYSKE